MTKSGIKDVTIFERKKNRVLRTMQISEDIDKNRIISEILLQDKTISADVIENIRSFVAGLQDLTEPSKKEFEKFEINFRILIC